MFMCTWGWGGKVKSEKDFRGQKESDDLIESDRGDNGEGEMRVKHAGKRRKT